MKGFQLGAYQSSCINNTSERFIFIPALFKTLQLPQQHRFGFVKQ